MNLISRTSLLSIAALASLTLASAPVTAQTAPAAHDEAVDGDISNDRLNPLELALGAGSNFISGSVIQGELDYVTVNIPEGHELSGLQVVSYDSANAISFIGLQEGTTFTEPPSGTNSANLLGFHLFGGADEGSDILPAIGNAGGTQQFDAPLPAGDYTFWIQETSTNLSTYGFDLQVTALGAPAPLCNGLEITVDIAAGEVATDGDDVILGTPGNDVINGLDGNDTICGLGGDDTIAGNGGDDTIFGDDGDDTLEGGRGRDTIDGGRGADEIFGNRGGDTLRGRSGADQIHGGNGADTIFGNNGADTLNGNRGTDTLSGGKGRDTLSGGNGTDSCNGGAGTDTANTTCETVSNTP